MVGVAGLSLHRGSTVDHLLLHIFGGNIRQSRDLPTVTERVSVESSSSILHGTFRDLFV